MAPREALIVLYWAMRSESQRRIHMVIEMASKPIVFFSSSTRNYSNIVTILKLIYCFKQNQVTVPSHSPLGGFSACYIGRIHLIYSVGGANGSPWWWWLGVVLCFEKREKRTIPTLIFYGAIVLIPARTQIGVKLLTRTFGWAVN